MSHAVITRICINATFTELLRAPATGTINGGGSGTFSNQTPTLYKPAQLPLAASILLTTNEHAQALLVHILSRACGFRHLR